MNDPRDMTGWIPGIGGRARTVEVVLTRGDGAHLDALARSFPSAVILAWVDGPAAARRVGRIVLVPEVEDRFGAAVRTLAVLGVETIEAHPPDAVAPGPPNAADFRRRLDGLAPAAAVEAATVRSTAGLWLDNLEANLAELFRLPAASAFAGVLDGRPALIVGSGPSRTHVLPRLSEWRRRVVVLAANSAIGDLAAAGVVPDAVVVLEGHDRSVDLARASPALYRDALLLVKASTHPAHLAWPFRRKAVYLGPTDAWLRSAFGPGSVVPTAGNVGTTALVLAWMLGARPILTTGLDFALAPDGAGARGPADVAAATVTGWGGEPRRAELPFVTYREETEQVLARIRDGDPHVQFVALSPDGARIEGMRQAPWFAVQEVLADLDATHLATEPRAPTIGEPETSGLTAALRVARETLDRVGRDPLGPAVGLALEAPTHMLIRTLVAAAHRASGADDRSAVFRAARLRLDRLERAVTQVLSGA